MAYARLLVFLCAVGFTQGDVLVSSAAVKSLGDEFFDWRLREAPEYATKFRLNRYNDRVEEWSREALQRRVDQAMVYQQQVADLLSMEFAAKEDKTSMLVLADILETFISGSQYSEYTLPINYELARMPSYSGVETVDSEEKLADWKSRVQGYTQVAADQIRLLGVGDGAGAPIYVLPRVTMEPIISTFENMLGDEMAVENFFAFKPWADLQDSINSTEVEAGRAVCTDLMNKLTEMVDNMKNVYLPTCRETTALSALPGGAEVYRAALRFHTTKDSTPEDVHQLGLQEVEKIVSQMNEIIEGQGFDGTVREYTTYLTAQPGQTFDTAEELVQGYEDMYNNRVLPKLWSDFEKLEGAIQFIADSSAGIGFYQSPSPDGSKKAAFRFSADNPEETLKVSMLPIVVHETMPGHHYQELYSQKNPVPDFRRFIEFRHYAQVPLNWPFYTSYSEGWGLYSEWLAPQLGIYETEVERFGALSLDSLRAARLVVDTGLHYYNWTVDYATDYLLNNTALGASACRSQVLRYVKWPGQACSYKVGQLRVVAMRERAEKELGKLFDVKEFHNTVLGVGPAPLSLVDDLVDEWIAGKKAEVSAAGIPVLPVFLLVLMQSILWM